MNEKIILLVEDNPDDIKLTQHTFDKDKSLENINLKVVHNGDDALDFLFGNSVDIHHKSRVMPLVILLDLNLPGMDGFQVLKRIRADKRTKLIPVIILTSSKQEEDIKKAYELGANSYIRKPVDFEKFSDVAQRLGIYWTDLNEPPV